ncbi:FAD-dependent oxidoreductase [Streptomyces sp. NPDC055239]
MRDSRQRGDTGHDGSASQWDAEHDVVVVGSGAGAMTGALRAAADGLDTVVIERTGLLGGTSAYSGAACWLPGTQVQERAGIGDSTEAARSYLRALLGDRERDRQEAFLAHAPELVARLERDPAVEFEWRAFPDYLDAPGRMPAGRSFVPLDLPADRLGGLLPPVRPAVDRDRAAQGHPDGPLTAGRALIGRLLLAFTATGRGQVRTGLRMTRLVTEPGGRVTGVEADGPDGTVRVRGRHGVLLAAGGFESDAEMRSEHGVPGSAHRTMAPRGANTGDAIRAAVEAGADTDLMDEAWWCPVLERTDGHPAFTLGLRGGLVVDGAGERFANESLPYDRMGRALAARPGPAYFVFDARSGGRPPAITVPDCPTQDHLAADAWVRADSLPELARLISVRAETLERTVARFNAFAGVGADEDFHRGEDPYDRFFAGREETGPNPCLVPLDRPPYYAVRMELGDLGTKGGLRTDVSGRVLDRAGRPIGGLYAAGNTSASFAGHVYPGPGVPIGSAMVFASLAAGDMARAAREVTPAHR